MARDDRDRPGTRNFGRIDPFCWAAVGPLLLVALFLLLIQVWSVGLVVVGIVVLVLVFDSWSNRPKPWQRRGRGRRYDDDLDFEPQPRTPPRRPAAPAGRPTTAQRGPAPRRAPQRGPGNPARGR